MCSLEAQVAQLDAWAQAQSASPMALDAAAAGAPAAVPQNGAAGGDQNGNGAAFQNGSLAPAQLATTTPTATATTATTTTTTTTTTADDNNTPTAAPAAPASAPPSAPAPAPAPASSAPASVTVSASPPAPVVSDINGLNIRNNEAQGPAPRLSLGAGTGPVYGHGHGHNGSGVGAPQHSHSPVPVPSRPRMLAQSQPAVQHRPRPHPQSQPQQAPGYALHGGSAAQQYRHPSTPSKVPILDPAGPGTGVASTGPLKTTGFPSPGRESMHGNPKFIDDRTRITYGIQQALPEAVRRSIRDNWEKCLLGSNFHQAFILNASIHHATPAAIQRAMRDFGEAMVDSAKNEIIMHIKTADLDELADRILAKASNTFLDKAVDIRLKTIEAKRLINALARAERLGYEPGDVEEAPGSAAPKAVPSSRQPFPGYQEHVGSNASPTYPGAQHPGAQHPGAQHPGAQAGMATPATIQPLHCGVCLRRFSHRSAYDHHVKGRVCSRTPTSPGGFKYSCQHCGQGFTTVMGLQYHNAHKVCGDYGEPVESHAMVATHTPATNHIAVAHPMQTTPNGSSSPVPVVAAAAPPSSAPDPYAHLSPEQLTAMQEELRDAEIKFAERIRQATLISDEAERKTKLDGLSNSFGTKQSLIRKKYGVRLRMRRTKAEIIAERDRIQYRTAAEVQADIGIVSAGPGRPVTSGYRPYADSSRSSSRPSSGGEQGSQTAAGASGWSSINQQQHHHHHGQAPSTLASSLTVPQPKIEDSGEVSMHGGKRRYSGEGESPSYKRIAYSEMGGLGGADADAETKDPTLTLAPSRKGSGTADEPLALDDSGSESDAESGDDEDIPAHLPVSVRQSLQRSSSVTAASRPGSSSMAR